MHLGAQVGEDGQNPPVVDARLGEAELAEDVLDVLLDRALGDVERPGDGVVGAAFGHEGEDLPFAGGERCEPPVAPAAGEELAHYFGIQHGPARGDLTDRCDEVGGVGHAVLEQVTDACSPRLEQLCTVFSSTYCESTSTASSGIRRRISMAALRPSSR
jgi:hypothetical protein